MTPLLQQFLSEGRELLQGSSQKLLQLEKEPDNGDLINELFRFVHTLKGNSGLFDFPELTRVLHAGEDLMVTIRNGQLAFSREIADELLESMDFVNLLLDEIESTEKIDVLRVAEAATIAGLLRGRLPVLESVVASRTSAGSQKETFAVGGPDQIRPAISDLPEPFRAEARNSLSAGQALRWVKYIPLADCFYQGEDPFFSVRQTPGLIWGQIKGREAWPLLKNIDAYGCKLDFWALTRATWDELADHFRYVMEQISFFDVEPEAEKSLPPLVRPDFIVLKQIASTQRKILELEDKPAWLPGRVTAVAKTLERLSLAVGHQDAASGIDSALQAALATTNPAALLSWLDRFESGLNLPVEDPVPSVEKGPKFGRRAEDTQGGAKSLKVDQAKIDRLMNLIGEMVVSKNALPYLAARAENQYGSRELSREIKNQYATINRIAEEMQDAIMQVRMMPVSVVFQRFPRLVREISHKLGKEVQLVLEGEETEADKNIIEALADPLIHVVRNSLDHGIETPDRRLQMGKPALGTLSIRAAQESDRVVIDVSDDGKGIDPQAIKRKALENGLLDAAGLERISDQDAINLVFAAGLSTAEVVSDLSGRGVGMDAVKTGVEKINGSILLESEVGKGTHIRISLPLSMAVTQVMIVETDKQLFGVPIDQVVETVRLPRSGIHGFKTSLTTVLRGRILPIKALNSLLGLASEPQANADDELAVLVVRLGNEMAGLLVDRFHQTVDVIQKPMEGVLSGLSVYSGSALMGDGAVLMILNIKEIL